jgi:tetratricopeptide (TPR) repeat protein
MGLKLTTNRDKGYFKSLFIIIVLNIIFISNGSTDERTNELNKLFKELKTNNISYTNKIEQKIWKIWSTHPTDKNLTLILAEGSILVNNNKLKKSINVFTKAINLDPYWAEAWNKRATAYYMIGEYKKSQYDIDKVLELEERHFGALAGEGLVNIKLENYEKAKKSYQKALEIYPSMKSPGIMIEQIEELIKRNST